MSIFSCRLFSLFTIKHSDKSKRFAVLRVVASLLGFLLLSHISVLADTTFTAALDRTQVVPSGSSNAAGVGTVILNTAETQVTVTLYTAGLSGAQNGTKIHGPAQRGRTAAAVFALPNVNFTQTFSVTSTQAADLKAGLWYFNIVTTFFPGGEIRGQIEPLAAPGAADLAGWYRGEANAFDTSINANNGTLQNGASFGSGQIGHAFNLDGLNDYAEIPDSTSLNITGRISLQAWISPASVQSGRIIDKQTNGGSDGYFLDISNGRLRVGIGGNTFQSTTNLNTNSWTHVAATYDGVKIRIYLNGSLNSVSPELAGSLVANSVPLRIGTDATATANFFSGQIDEVQIHNRALSSPEIKAIYGSNPFPLSNGTLDQTFGNNGIVVTQFGTGSNVPQAVALQADGKIVAAGFSSNGTNNDFAVVRYNPNGTLDDTFDGANNGNGIVTTPIGTSDEEAFGVRIQPDGKIILAGETFNGTKTNIAVVRYNPDGTLDNTFDGDGRVVTQIGSSGTDLARSVIVQPDGKIVVAGNSFNGSNSDIVVVRYESNGSLDAAFDGNSGVGNGIVTTAIGPGNDLGYTVALQPDGKIVVSGYYFSGLSNDTAILRYDQSGVLDTSFDNDGIVTRAFSSDTDEALTMTMQPDGKIVIAGCIRNGMPNDFLFARFNQDGSSDNSFGINGWTTVPFSPLADIALGVAIQPDGKIVAAGFANNGSNNDFGVARLNSNGTPDTSFDGDGRLTTPIGTSTDSPNAIAVQPDGKIVAVGRTVVGSFAEFGVVRYGYGTNTSANDGFFAADKGVAVRFDNAFRAGTTSSAVISPLGIPALPSGLSLLNRPREILTSAAFSGDVQIKLTLPASVDLANFTAAQVMQFENGTWADRTLSSPVRDFATRSIYARISLLTPFVVVSSLTQSPSFVSVNGRLFRADGRGSNNVIVTITDGNGQQLSGVTNPFGYYRFRNVSARNAYLIRFASKRAIFSPGIFSTPEDIEDFDIVAEP